MEITKELLVQLYVTELMSCSQIAKIIPCDSESVRLALHRFSIPVRKSGGNSFARGERYGITKEILEQEYTHNGKTQQEIANMLGCGTTVIYNAMKTYGIEPRPRPLHLKGRKQTLEHRTKNAQAHIGVTAGDKNPKWKGGVSTDHTAIRRRSEHLNWRSWILRIKGDFCEQCGKDLNARCSCCDHKPDKHVHHIKDFANHPELRSDPNNGLVLCESCHRKMHTK
jgi:transposase